MIASSLTFSSLILLTYFIAIVNPVFAEDLDSDEVSSEKALPKETLKAGVISFKRRKQAKFRFREFKLHWQLKHPFKVVRATVEGMGAMRINVANLSEGLRLYARIAMRSVKFPEDIPAQDAFREIGLYHYKKKTVVYFSSVMEIVGQKGDRVVFRTLGTNTFGEEVSVQQVNFECLPAPKVLKCKMDGKLSLSSLGLRAPSLLGVVGDDFITFWGEGDLTPEI